MTTRAQIVEAAREWIGVPFRHQGRTRAGIDCAGLVILVGKRFNLLDYKEENYPRLPGPLYIERFKENMIFVSPVTAAQDGDALLFQYEGLLCHCGIMATVDGQPGVIHAIALNRRVIEETLEECEEVCGKPRYAFRYPGVEI